MNEWMNEWMNAWINEWKNEWQRKCLQQWSNEWLHMLPVSFSEIGPEPPSCCNLSESKLTLQARAPLANLILQKKNDHVRFFQFLSGTELSPQSGAPFADLMSQKTADHVTFKSDPTLPILFASFVWHRALARVLCTFCRQLLPIEAPNVGNKDPPLFPKETHAGPSLFKPEFTPFQTVTLPIYLMMMWLTWFGWHDGAVEMMMWFPWWWES